MTNFIAFLLTKGKEVSFLSALQKEQKNKTIVSTERRLLNIYILLLFKRHFDAGLGGGGVLIIVRLSFYISFLRHLSFTEKMFHTLKRLLFNPKNERNPLGNWLFSGVSTFTVCIF